MTTRRCYETKLYESRTLIVGYDAQSDSYLIRATNGAEVRSICLSQEAMEAVVNNYIALLRYQAQCAPDGVGAEL